MSSGFMFDKIILNLFSNKALNQHMEVVDSYFTKTEDNNICLYRGSLQDFHGIKQLMKDLILYSHIETLKK